MQRNEAMDNEQSSGDEDDEADDQASGTKSPVKKVTSNEIEQSKVNL